MPRKRTSFASRVKSRRGDSAAHSPTPPAPPPAQLNPSLSEGDESPPRQKQQQEPDEGFVAVGRVLGPFGLKGELRVQPLTDNPQRFEPKARLWAGAQPLTVEASREAQSYVYLRLKGFRDRSSVERFRHALLQVPESTLAPLPEGEYYRFQLIGLAVVTRDGETLGRLDEIIETGANDVYRVRMPDGADLLLPALHGVIVSVDLQAKRMVVDPPDWR